MAEINEEGGTRRGPGNKVLYGLILLALVAIAALFAWPKDRGDKGLATVEQDPGVVSLVTQAPDNVREVPSGTFFSWSREEFEAPVTIQSDGVRITVMSEADGDSGLFTPVFRIEAPDMASHILRGDSTTPSNAHRIGVGRLNRQARIPHVVLATYSGGAHCCTTVMVAAPVGTRFQTIDLGEWDGAGVNDFPSDLSGDGVADFVFSDNAFLYTFASYADSFAPPVILNVVGTRVENVSRARAFRPQFGRFVERARPACLSPDSGIPNGACAGYVAAAARLGRFDQAWADMLRAYDPDAGWDVPPSCRVEARGICPDDQQIVYDYYPEALYQFLIDTGYIAPGTPRPGTAATAAEGDAAE